MTHPIQKASTRVIINTIAQYSRSLISIVVALYSTRLILQALGQNDYGIYSLIAGVVTMLAFISNALVVTTQRFLSFHQSQYSEEAMKKLWSNILTLHLLFSVLLIILMECVEPLLFDGFLNISDDKISSAKYVYQCCIFMVTISFLSSPFLALLISHENIVYSSVIQVIDSLLRLGIAVIITYYGSYKLELFVSLLCVVSLGDLISYGVYTYRKYPECIWPRICHFEKKVMRSISSFMVWQIYSTGCTVGRTQGCAVVLNKFFGTAINTSFGIAQQVSGAISFVSGALLNAINPQIIKAEGSGMRQKMFELAMTACKFSFFLLSMIALPLIVFMPEILELWLGEVPVDSVLFCRVILLTSLCDQTTIGLGTANQAIGDVKKYALTINTIKIFTVVALAFMLYLSVPLKYAIWSYAVIELICAVSRLPFLKISGGLKIKLFCKNVFHPLFLPLVCSVILYSILHYIGKDLIFVICGVLIITIVYGVIFYRYSLTKDEVNIADNILHKLHIK